MTYVLIPGAGGDAWYWHRLVAELERRGRRAVAVDLPAADDAAGLPEYVEAVVAAIGDGPAPVLVAQSMGGLTAPIVCTRVPVRLLVLLNAMIPLPGETGGEWWEVTGQPAARAALAAAQGRTVGDGIDVMGDFFHDVPDDVTAEAMRRGETAQSGTPFGQPWPLDRWPDGGTGPGRTAGPTGTGDVPRPSGVPTRVLAGRDDRLFPLEFQRRLARERLGLPVDEIPGGHLVALSRPVELADRLEAYVGELDRVPR